MGFCLVAGSAAADTLPSKPPQYRFDVFGTEAGLPQTNVTAAVQTRDGYLWVGTEAGLGRFDGVRFVSWRKSNTAALLSHSIRCLFEDREGALWIGTEKGLVHYRDGRFEHAGFADAVVTAIAQARDGHLWVGTAESGLHRLADRRADAATQRTDLGGGIQCLFFDSSDRLWVGVRDRPGVLYRNDGEWIHFDGNGRIGGHTNAICETPGGTIWLGNAFGVYRIRKNGAVTHFGKAAGLLYVQIRDIRPAKDGGLWIASSVLHHVSNLETFDCLPIANPGVRSINRLCEDAEGNVWLCAMAEALVRVRRAHFRTFPAIDEIPGPVIKAVAEDPHGDIWIAVQRTGVARLKPDGRLEPLPIESGLPSADPRSILAARDGAVWIAYSNGLSVWRDGTLQTYSAQRFVHAMYEDASGRIWFGGERVFATYEQGRGLQPFPTDSIGTLSPYAFAADNTGAIYVGLPTGVRKYRDGVAEKIAGLDELPTGPVRALFVDSEGRLWVGMKGRGLGVLADEA